MARPAATKARREAPKASAKPLPRPPSPPPQLVALDSALGTLEGALQHLEVPRNEAAAEHMAGWLARATAALTAARRELTPLLTLPGEPSKAPSEGTAERILLMARHRISELSWLLSGITMPPRMAVLSAHLSNVHAVLRRGHERGATLVMGPRGELIARFDAR